MARRTRRSVVRGEQLQARRKDPDPDFDPSTARGRANLAALGAHVEANGALADTPPAAPQRSAAADRRVSASARRFCAV